MSQFKLITSIATTAILTGCINHVSYEPTPYTRQNGTSPPACLGTTTLPPTLQSQFESVNDPTLLAEALGEPNQGKLCQGQVYQVKEKVEVVLYRAWNSTNPKSKMGQWWAFSQPSGAVATYRTNNEICYQWSPLDMMVRCQLKANTKVVVGTGQSAQCSQYLSYPVSSTQQVYLNDAATALDDCQVMTGYFHWQ